MVSSRTKCQTSLVNSWFRYWLSSVGLFYSLMENENCIQCTLLISFKISLWGNPIKFLNAYSERMGDSYICRFFHRSPHHKLWPGSNWKCSALVARAEQRKSEMKALHLDRNSELRERQFTSLNFHVSQLTKRCPGVMKIDFSFQKLFITFEYLFSCQWKLGHLTLSLEMFCSLMCG